MKLLIVSHSCTIPVGQQFYAEIERQTGWDLTIVTPKLWKDEYGNQLVTPRWQGYGGKLISLPVWKSGNVPLHAYRSLFIQLLKEINPDFIYLYQKPYAIVTFQAYLANYLSIRKPIGFFTWQNIYKQYPFPFKQMESWILRNTSMMFTGSRSAEEVFRKKGYGSPSMLLPSGIDPAIYYPRLEADQLAAELRQHPNEVLVGYAGRIVEQKGLKTLLHALEQIRDLPWRLVILGAGFYQTEFDQIAQSLHLGDRICHLGFVSGDKTPLYISAFDVLVLPSETRANWKEQFGRVIIESMACGTPVIGSDSGEIPYLLKETGGGLVFPERQSDALANQLKQLITRADLRSQLAKRGQQSVLDRYTHAPIALRFAKAIENAVQHQKTEQILAG
jgi:L-malate glycosyltransferase